MTDDDTRDFDPTNPEAWEVAAMAAYDREEFLSMMPHFYRGEVSQAGKFLDRLDLTVN